MDEQQRNVRSADRGGVPLKLVTKAVALLMVGLEVRSLRNGRVRRRGRDDFEGCSPAIPRGPSPHPDVLDLFALMGEVTARPWCEQAEP
ncbi:hypothetical protein ACJ6WF_11455 [Streptomyces sp. MMS24-I2-30]|uniref:hypothetical protein n=1 Tax=Streptomyces sp. MMS24-I2-30 TaxID=3351564 RepID=UPI003896A2D6